MTWNPQIKDWKMAVLFKPRDSQISSVDFPEFMLLKNGWKSSFKGGPPPDPVMKVGAHNFAYFRVKNNPSYQFIRPSIGAPCHSMYKLDPKRPPTRWTSSSFGSTHLGGKTTAHHTRPWHRWCHSVARSNALVGFKRLLVRKGCPGRYWNGLQHRGHRDPVHKWSES